MRNDERSPIDSGGAMNGRPAREKMAWAFRERPVCAHDAQKISTMTQGPSRDSGNDY